MTIEGMHEVGVILGQNNNITQVFYNPEEIKTKIDKLLTISDKELAILKNDSISHQEALSSIAYKV